MSQFSSRTLPKTTAQSSRRIFFRSLDRPSQIFSNLTPNWFASVMGTGIVAVAAATLPLQFPGLRFAAVVIWTLSAILLVLLTGATCLHWVLYHRVARIHHLHPVIAYFYGAPPMAFMTVGAGALLLGKDWMGLPIAIGVDFFLWGAGTLGGIFAAVFVTYLAFTRHEIKPDSAFGGWLMPVVPPMVSASTGALLLPYARAGQLRETLFWFCYSCFGLSLVSSMIIVTLIWSRFVQHKVGVGAMVPTMWIVLGPIGQSMTAVNLLATSAPSVVDIDVAQALLYLALVYSFAVFGFALFWTALASIVTIRAFRSRLPFSLTWWSFTFPIGTCVTGLNGLWSHSELGVVAFFAVIYYAALVVAWSVVGVRTFHGSVVRGTLLLPPKP